MCPVLNCDCEDLDDRACCGSGRFSHKWWSANGVLVDNAVGPITVNGGSLLKAALLFLRGE